ncbi:hypothetical protein [Curtobacterium poinsettiae]|uniref:hypothetical protein n=1 Tax=Curtobacterium poinsettiae TaxID=159612 RepID=UPI0021C86B2D|nr:hypothetical protein [Curtobacterium flaccumfaciens]MCU0151354.1 hypothetical protein [Curtobacterium flaccumfaciens pv. poinsettiae]UXN16626.1 hypothetical protein N8D76_08060 [Curtobacterium flaccumfaciens pv. poinsettiae]
MAGTLIDEAGDYGNVVDATRLTQFLATQNWTIQNDLGYAQIWSEPGVTGDLVRRILIPRDTGLDDYGLRLAQALARVSDTYDWSVANLAEQVAAVSADLFFVRVDQHMSDGTIPLRQASALLENIDDMIRSAALTAANPRSTGRGRIPTAVNDFLNDDVRMGHTKRGSFIITVAARLDAPTVEDTPADGTDDDELAPSFTRQVMTTLARSLDVTKQVAENHSDAPNIDDAIASGMRLPMVKALQSMGSGEGLRALDMSFEWAPVERQRTPVNSKIEMTRETVQLLERVSDRLVRKNPPKQVTVTGPVIELRRGDARDDDGVGAGEIVLRADIDNAWRKVSITLTGDDYDIAIQAHREKFPLTVTGILDKPGRSWILEHPILDRSFFDFRNRQS